MPENSPVDSVVVVVNVHDPDNDGPKGKWQKYNCSAIDDASGRFVVKGNVLRVSNFAIARSRDDCDLCITCRLPQVT